MRQTGNVTALSSHRTSNKSDRTMTISALNDYKD